MIKIADTSFKVTRNYVRSTMPEDCKSIELGVAEIPDCNYSYPIIYIALFIDSMIYISIYLYINPYVYTHLCNYMCYMYISVCVCVCVCVCVFMCVYVCVNLDIGLKGLKASKRQISKYSFDPQPFLRDFIQTIISMIFMVLFFKILI